MKALAVAEGKLEDAIIGCKDEDIACGVEDCGADLAVFKMALDIGAGGSVEGIVEIAGDLVPDVTAIQNHENLLRFAGTAL
jgi:hypothetical protein